MQSENKDGQSKHLKELSNLSSQSKLAKRLYRNSSLNRLNPHGSILASSPIRDSDCSMLNKSNSSQLIASISLKKLRKGSDSQRYLEFSKGKILVNPNHSCFESLQYSKENNKSNRKMFQKLQRLDYSPKSSLNRILPDDLIDYPIEDNDAIEYQLTKKSSNSFFRSKLKKNQSKSIEINPQQDLIPEDFIQLLTEDNLTNQFCYLKKMDHPYDLKIIQFDKNFEKKNTQNIVDYPSEYITISSRGITYFSPQHSRFVPLKQWKREAEYFRKIVKLDFFKNFKIIKNFGSWKKYIRKSAMKETVQQLKEKLVYGDRFLLSSILQTREYCVRLQNQITYCKLEDTQQVLPYRQFKHLQQSFIQNDFIAKVMDVEEDIKTKLIINMSESMKEFKQQNKISSSVEEKGMPLLIGDQKNLEMPYTKQATLRTQQQKFQKFIKLIDLMITHSKVNMMSQSTNKLVHKIEEENENYEKQVIESKYKHTYKGKQFLKCEMSLDPRDHGVQLKPNRQEVNSLFQQIVSRSVVRLCRNHKKISQDSDILSIIYDNQDNCPKEVEGDMLKMIMTSDQRQEGMLEKIMNAVNIAFNYIVIYSCRFQKLALDNFKNLQDLRTINENSAKDHQNILQRWNKQLETISQISEQHESSIILLDLKQFKQKTLHITTTCINKAKQIIPKVFEAKILDQTAIVSKALAQMQNDPLGVQSHITFQRNKVNINQEIEEYSNTMMQINCLDILIKNMVKGSNDNAIKNRDKEIKQLQIKLNLLRKKLEETDINSKLHEKRAQDDVNEMIPKNKTKLAELYTRITIFDKQEKDSKATVNFIEKKQKQLQEIVIQSNNIQDYQNFLKLQVSDSSNLQNFREFFNVYKKIWKTSNQYEEYQAKILNLYWEEVNTEEVFQKFQEFITIIVTLQKSVISINNKDFLYQFSVLDSKTISSIGTRIDKMKPLIETIQYLTDKSFSENQMKELKSILETKGEKQITKILQKQRSETSTEQLRKSGIYKETQLIKGILLKAKRNNEVVFKTKSVDNFIKTHMNILRILSDKTGFKIEDFLQQLEDKIVLANFEDEDLDVMEKYKVTKDKSTLQKLREIILLWIEHQKHTEYFEKFEKLADWKSTKQGKIYVNEEQNWKKNIKQYKDTQLGKIPSANEKLMICSLKQCNQQLQNLYPFTMTYLNTKRHLSPRIAFLNDEQILKIYAENKDFRAFGDYVIKIFPFIQKLITKQQEQVPSEAINTSGQILILKPGRISSFEVDQMIKLTQQSMKTALKASFKSCLQAFQDQQFNQMDWIQKNPLQILIFVNDIYITRLLQEDYLSQNGQNMQRLIGYHQSQIEKLKGQLNTLQQSESNNILIKKIQILLVQSVHNRDRILDLIHKDVTSINQYEWLRQIRHYYQHDMATIDYLVYNAAYGFEFVSLTDSDTLFLSYLMDKSVIQQAISMFLCNNVNISNSTVLREFALYNGKSYHELMLTSGKQKNIIQNFIIGTFLTGSLAEIYLPKILNSQQLSLISTVVKQIQLALTRKQPYLRGFKHLTLNKQSGISLISQSQNYQTLYSSLHCDFRVIQVPEIPYQTYLQFLLEPFSQIDADFSKKLNKSLNCIKQTFNLKKPISFKQLKEIIDPIAIISNKNIPISQLQIPNEAKIVKKVRQIIVDKVNSETDRKIVSWIFKQTFNIGNFNKQAYSSRSLHQICYNDAIIMNIKRCLIKNRVCVIEGKNHLTNLVVAEKFSCSYQKDVPNIFYLNQENYGSLFGAYFQDKWQDGVITQKLKESKNQYQYIILVGKATDKILRIMEKLNDKFVLENGQDFANNFKHKFMLIAQNQISSVTKQMNIQIFNTNLCKLKAEDLFEQELELTKIDEHFVNSPTNFSFFNNLLINSCEKITNSNLKILGHKNEFLKAELIIKKCLKILNAVLATDKESCCVGNMKMLQKAIFWSLFWAIGSSLPKPSMEKLQKMLFELIKIDYDRSHFLGETKFMVADRNQTVSKGTNTSIIVPIKNSLVKINAQLQSKTHFIKLMTRKNNSIFLTGERGSGKSLFLSYLTSALPDQNCCTVKLSIRNNMTLSQFLGKIKPKTILRNKKNHQQPQKYESILDSNNGKKLLILLDNFNFLDQNSNLYRFFWTAISYGYYIDEYQCKKIALNNISFICTENSSYTSIEQPFIINNLIAVSLNSQDSKSLIQTLAHQLDPVYSQSENNIDFFKKLLDSIGSLNNFAINIQNTMKQVVPPSNNTVPMLIAKDMISYYKKGNRSNIDLLTMWKYLSMKKYIDSGYKMNNSSEIKHEITNLSNLISKNNSEQSQILQFEHEIVKQLFEQFPLLNTLKDIKDYYAYLLYLVSSQNKHLIRINQKQPSTFKAKILSSICHKKHLNFIHVENVCQLFFDQGKQNPTMYYISDDNNNNKKSIIESVLIKIVMDSQQALSNRIFIIDMHNQSDLEYYSKYYPDLYQLCSVYSKQNQIVFNKLPCSNIFNYQDYSKDICWQIALEYSQLEQSITNTLNSRSKIVQTANNNFNQLELKIVQLQQNKSKLKVEIQQFDEQENLAIASKNQVVSKLKQLLSNGNQDENFQSKKEQLNKQISQLDQQLNTAKRNKIEAIQTVTKLDQDYSQKKNLSIQLVRYSQQYQQNHNTFQKIRLKPDYLVFVFALLQTYYKNVNQYTQLLQKVEQISNQYFSMNLSKLIKIIYGIQISSCAKQQWLIKWILSGYQAQFVTNKASFLKQKLNQKVLNSKICSNQYQIHENQGKFPIITSINSSWGKPQVSIIRPQPTDRCQKDILYQFSHEDHTQKFKLDLYQIVDIQQSHQLKFRKDEVKRFYKQIFNMQNRLKSKFQHQSIVEANKNYFSEVKQCINAINMMQQRIVSSQNQVQQIISNYNTKYAEVMQRCIGLQKYLFSISQMFPYFVYNASYLKNIIKKALEQQKYQKSESQEKQQENKQQNKQKSEIENQKNRKQALKQSGKKIIENVNYWVSIGLDPSHAIFAYFLLACLVQKQKKLISAEIYEQITNIYHKKQNASQQLKNKMISKQFNQIIEMLNNKNYKGNELPKMINYAEKQLELNFNDKILNSKRHWQQELPSLLFKENQPCKFYVAYGSSKDNSYKLIDKEISVKLGPQQHFLILSESQYGQDINDSLQKLNSTQQSWLLISNWKKISNIKKIINFVGQCSLLRLVIYFDYQKSKQEIIKTLKLSKFCQVWLYQNSKGLCFKVQKIFAKFFNKSSNGEISKILKVHAVQIVTRIIKGLSQKQIQISSYQHRPVEELLKNQKITSKDLVLYFLDFYYHSENMENRLTLRQMKRISKQNSLFPDILEDNTPVEWQNLLNETYEVIKPMICQSEKLREFLTSIIPKAYLDKIQFGEFYGFHQNQQSELHSGNNTKISRKQVSAIINNVLNKAPNASVTIQDTLGRTLNSMSLSKQIIKADKQEFQKQMKKLIEKYRYLNRILETNKSLRTDIISQLMEVQSKGAEKIIQKLNLIDNKITIFRKQLTEPASRAQQDTGIMTKLCLLKDSKKYLQVYLMQNNVNNNDIYSSGSHNKHKLEQTHHNSPVHLVAKCLLDKQKQIYREHIEKGQYLCIKNLRIHEARFDSHKFIIENIQESSQQSGTPSPLTNIYIYFEAQDTNIHPSNNQASVYRKIPLKVNGQKLTDVIILSKCKETGLWGPHPYIEQM